MSSLIHAVAALTYTTALVSRLSVVNKLFRITPLENLMLDGFLVNSQNIRKCFFMKALI